MPDDGFLRFTGLLKFCFIIVIVFLGQLFCSDVVWAEYSPNPLDNAIYHAQQGTTQMKLEKYDLAIEEFQASIRLNPYSTMTASVYNNMGLAYLKMQQYPLAMVSFQRAFRIQPNYETYYKNMVSVYQASGGMNTAMQMLEDVIIENPDDAEAFYLLALISEARGETSLAQKCFSHYLELKPNAIMAHAAEKHLTKKQLTELRKKMAEQK